MMRLAAVAGVVVVVIVAAACGSDTDPSGTPAPNGSAATPRPSPIAIQVDSCMDTIGVYTVHVPPGWWTNPEYIDNDAFGFVSSCRFFAPAEFDPMSGDRSAPVPSDVAISVSFIELCLGYVSDVLDERLTTVDGYPARAEELGSLAVPTEPTSYQYVVTLTDDEDSECSRQAVWARTDRSAPGGYPENKAALDDIMESIEIDPAPVEAACDGGEVTLSELLVRDVEPRANCLGSRPVTFRAYVSPRAGTGTCLTRPIPGDEGLPMCDGPSRILVPLPGDEDGLTAFLPEGMDLEEVPTDTWILATGHFDDPAAATCAGHDVGVFVCRLAFVLDSVELEQ
jgi:hypothetical protein